MVSVAEQSLDAYANVKVSNVREGTRERVTTYSYLHETSASRRSFSLTDESAQGARG